MKYYHNSPLLYEKGFSVEVCDADSFAQASTYYYFDYDERNHSINMEFPHFHLYYEMMILLSPKAYHFVKGKRYDIVANDIVLLPPSTLHQSEYLPGPPSDRIIIGFLPPRSAGYYEPGYQRLLSIFDENSPILRFHREQQNAIFQPLNELAEACQNERDRSVRDLMIHTKFTDFLTRLYLARGNNQYAPNVQNGIKEKIYNIANYIQTHYCEDLSLKQLADCFYVSPYYLSHLFKEVTGYTVVQYIQLTRIKNAQFLLLNSDTRITQIAAQTGFSSFSQFNRVFRKICSMSPSDYKLTSQQTDKTVVLSSVNI